MLFSGSHLKMNKFAIPLIAFFTLLGFFVMTYTLKPGIGVGPDSAMYLASADSLLRGEGLSIPTGIGDPIPLTHFAPLYPTLLASFSFFGLDPYNTATWLQTILFPSILFLTGFVLTRNNKDFLWLAPLASLLISVSEDTLTIHSYAWSEPLFIFLCISGLFLFAITLVETRSLLLIGSILLLSLAFLTRYAGVALIPTIFLGTMLFHRSQLVKRLWRSLILSLACSLAPMIWLVRNYNVSGDIFDRSLVYHPLTASDIQNGLDTLSNWILPGRITGIIRDGLTITFLVAILTLIGIGILINTRRTKVQSDWTLVQIIPAIFFIFSLSYALVLVFTILFVDAQSSFTPRLLTPVLISGIITSFSILPFYLPRISKAFQFVLGFLILFIIGFNTMHAVKWISRSHAGSFKMYAGDGWKEAEIIHQIRDLPDGYPIYSNGEDAIYFVTHKPAARFPRKSNPFTLKENADYPLELEQMIAVLYDRGGFVVCFSGMTWRGYLPDCEELAELMPLKNHWAGDEGVIYIFGPE